MTRFITAILLLGGLVGGGMWLKDHYQDFVKQGLGKFAPQNKEQNFPRNFEDNSSSDITVIDDKRENKNMVESSEFKALPTQNANTQRLQALDKKYKFTYIFRDAKEKGVQFEWTGDKKTHDMLTQRFGLPKDFFQGGRYTPQQLEELQRKGSFRQVMLEGKQYTIPDYNKIARENRVVTAPIYKMIRQYLGKNFTNTRLLETLMTFCQDIPYKRPPASRKGKYIGELDVPAKMLTTRTGDCDTKSVFFASTLLHQPNIKVVVVLVSNPDHMFAAIKGVPTAYQSYITYQGEKYIVCEPVGNARLPIGKLGFQDCRTRLVVKVNP